jgi:hypothetical protein
MNQNLKTQRKIIGSVQRAADILNLFDTQVVELGTTEIARSLGLTQKHNCWIGAYFTTERLFGSEP